MSVLWTTKCKASCASYIDLCFMLLTTNFETVVGGVLAAISLNWKMASCLLSAAQMQWFVLLSVFLSILCIEQCGRQRSTGHESLWSKSLIAYSGCKVFNRARLPCIHALQIVLIHVPQSCGDSAERFCCGLHCHVAVSKCGRCCRCSRCSGHRYRPVARPLLERCRCHATDSARESMLVYQFVIS